jgi:hypothetical protein
MSAYSPNEPRGLSAYQPDLSELLTIAVPNSVGCQRSNLLCLLRVSCVRAAGRLSSEGGGGNNERDYALDQKRFQYVTHSRPDPLEQLLPYICHLSKRPA